jgi:cytochrome c556
MKKWITGFTLGMVVASGTSMSFAQMKLEEAIEYRKAGYSFMSWNMGKIKAQTVDESAPFNKEQMIAAANAIASIANSGMGALYLPGSDMKEMRGTKLKPDFFKKTEEAATIARNFTAAANNLATVAATGDKAAIARAFGETGQACKACHDKFRAK